MSVLIKGVDIPKSCVACWVEDDNGAFELCGNCPVWGLLEDEKITVNDLPKDSRLPDCPLVEVLTPHGDLIDKQVLLQDLFDCEVEMSQSGYQAKLSDAFDEVELAIPVIEEEKIS